MTTTRNADRITAGLEDALFMAERGLTEPPLRMPPAALLAYHEACCRELRHLARGHSANDAVMLLKAEQAVRALGADDINPYPSRALARIAVEAISAIRDATGVPHLVIELLMDVHERLARVSHEDPLSMYSDKDKWWPHVDI